MLGKKTLISKDGKRKFLFIETGSDCCTAKYEGCCCFSRHHAGNNSSTPCTKRMRHILGFDLTCCFSNGYYIEIISNLDLWRRCNKCL